MKELICDCKLYLRTEENETIDQAKKRLERILKSEGLDYKINNYVMTAGDEDD